MLLKKATDYITIIFAGILYAIALKYFILPSKVILTGTEGIAASLSYYYDDYWLFIVLYIVFQSLLMIFAYFSVSKSFTLRTIMVVGTVIIFLSLLPEFSFAKPEPHNERIILVIFGGILAGTAKAIAFQKNGSTGDEDIPGAYFAMKYLKPVGKIAVVAAVFSTGFGLIMEYLKTSNFEYIINTLMYTSIYIFISAETLNNLYNKFKITMVVIITKKCDQIGDAITSELSHRTYTKQEGIGGKSGSPLRMIRTIITKEELTKIIDIVEKTDPESFYYHHDIEGVSRRYYIEPMK